MSPLLDLTRSASSGPASWSLCLSLVSALATYLILTGLTPIAPRDDVVLTALFFNVVLIAAMIAVIAWQGIGMWRPGAPSSRARGCMCASCCCSRSSPRCPRMLLAVAATTTFPRSLDGWFSERTRAIISNSLDVAKVYVDEHGQLIRTDGVNMVRDIDAAADQIKPDSTEFQQNVMAQAGSARAAGYVCARPATAASYRGCSGIRSCRLSLCPLNAIREPGGRRCRC